MGFVSCPSLSIYNIIADEILRLRLTRVEAQDAFLLAGSLARK